MKAYQLFNTKISIQLKGTEKQDTNDYCYYYDVVITNKHKKSISYKDVTWFSSLSKTEDDIFEDFLSRPYPLVDPIDKYGNVFNSEHFNQFAG